MPEPEAAQPDYESMSLEQLDAVLEGRTVPESAPTDAPAPAAEPETPPQPTPEATPTAEPPAPDQPAEPEFDAQHEIELLKAQVEQAELGRKHWEQVAGRHGSKIGFLEEQLRARATAPLTPTPADDGGDVDAPASPPPAPRAERDRLASWAVAQAARGAYHSFLQQNPDYAEHAAQLQAYAQERGVNPDAILLSNDPGQVEAEVTGLLNGHLLHVQQQRVAARIEALKAKRAESTTRAADARRAASTSAAGVRSAPPQQPKKLDEMTLEELDAVMEQSTGGRW